MKLALVTVCGLVALGLGLTGCGSTETPPEDVIQYEATNPALVVEEESGVQYVYLTEGPSYFAEDSVQVREGTVVFYVSNEAERDVSLLLTPIGLRDEEHAIFRLNVPKGKTATHKIDLKPGLYEYSCPVNPTQWYPMEVMPNR